MLRVKDIESVDIGSDLHAFSIVNRVYDVNDRGDRVDAGRQVSAGVATTSELQRLRSGEGFEQFSPLKASSGRYFPFFLTPAGKTVFSESYVPMVDSKVRKELAEKGDLILPDANVDFVGIAAERGFTAADLCFFNMGDYTMIDVQGVPLRAGIRFNDMTSRITDAYYDLESVVEALKDNPEIRFVPDRYETGPICPLPSYNATEDERFHLPFIWEPSDSSWKSLLAELGFDPHKPAPLRIKPEMVLEVDFFGIDKFRCNPEPQDGPSP